jgi:hypothetical protein
MKFMKKTPYLGRIVFLTLSITLAPWPQLSAAIKQSTDDQGTIHINNIGEDTEKVKEKNYVPPAPPPVRPHKSEVGKPQPPTPSNIIPKAEETDDEEDSKSPDDDD